MLVKSKSKYLDKDCIKMIDTEKRGLNTKNKG